VGVGWLAAVGRRGSVRAAGGNRREAESELVATAGGVRKKRVGKEANGDGRPRRMDRRGAVACCRHCVVRENKGIQRPGLWWRRCGWGEGWQTERECVESVRGQKKRCGFGTVLVGCERALRDLIEASEGGVAPSARLRSCGLSLCPRRCLRQRSKSSSEL